MIARRERAGLGNRIHPTAVVGDAVDLGEGNVVGPYAVVLGPCSLMVGNPARQAGLNTVGLTRRGCPDGLIPALEAYLRGRAELPAGLPDDVAEMLERWERARAGRPGSGG